VLLVSQSAFHWVFKMFTIPCRQSNVATRLRSGGIFNDCWVANFLEIVTVKEFRKTASIWLWLTFFAHSVVWRAALKGCYCSLLLTCQFAPRRNFSTLFRTSKLEFRSSGWWKVWRYLQPFWHRSWVWTRAVLSQGNRAKPCEFRYVKLVGNAIRNLTAIERENTFSTTALSFDTTSPASPDEYRQKMTDN